MDAYVWRPIVLTMQGEVMSKKRKGRHHVVTRHFRKRGRGKKKK